MTTQQTQQIIHELAFNNAILTPLLHIWQHLQNMSNLPQLFHIVTTFSLLFIIITILLYLFRKLLIIRYNLTKNAVILDITPPAFTQKSAYTTQQLFSIIHKAQHGNRLLNQILGRKTLFSFELVSTKEKGIRYLIRTDAIHAKNMKRTLLSYLPYGEIKETSDYMLSLHNNQKNKIIELQLGEQFAFPLEKQNLLNQHDPLAYITGMMTKLKHHECVAYQLVISPTHSAQTYTIQHMLRRNEDVISSLKRPRIPTSLNMLGWMCHLCLLILNKIGQELSWAITEIFHGSNRDHIYAYTPALYQQQVPRRLQKPKREISAHEQSVNMSLQEKIDQPLFEASLRLFIVMQTNEDLQERIDGLKAAFALFSVPHYQYLQAKWNFLPFMRHLRLLSYQHRLLSLFNNTSTSLLSLSEVADLYHFPYTTITHTENIAKRYWKELPVPTMLKQDIKYDVVFAKNTYGGELAMIGIMDELRERHMGIFGGTGNGKTTQILTFLTHDLARGKGLAFIDPHGDAAEKALLLVPKEREKDVVFIDPSDIAHPVAINLMELTPNLSPLAALKEKEDIAESIISIFRRVCAVEFAHAGSNAFRIEYTLRNTIYTAFTIPDCTLFTIYDLLHDAILLKETVDKLTDQRLRRYWKNEYGKGGDYQQVKSISGITARIGRFLNSEAARRMFEHPTSSVHFDQLMDSKKIIICKLAKGELREDITQVIGTTILTKIQLATMRRTRVAEEERVPFYLYVDEFQTFATKTFIEMMEEARKYKVRLIIAEQSTAQQHKELNDRMFANLAIIICFRTAGQNDADILQPIFAPHVSAFDLMNLPWYHFYIKIFGQIPMESFSGETIPLVIPFDKEKIDRIIALSRFRYARTGIPRPVTQATTITKDASQTKEKRKGKATQKELTSQALPHQSTVEK